MKYLLLAELGYEVAQSNAAFIMDRKETEMYQVKDLILNLTSTYRIKPQTSTYRMRREILHG